MSAGQMMQCSACGAPSPRTASPGRAFRRRAGWWVTQLAERGGTLTPAQTAKARVVGPALQAMVRRAHGAHVRMAFGTDTGVSPHGMNAHEFVLLVGAGLSPLEAIQMATVDAADHLQLNTTIGRVAPGYSADI